MSQGAAGNVRKRIVEPRLQVGDGMGEGTQLIAVQQPGVLSSDVATQGVRAAGLIVPPHREHRATAQQSSRSLREKSRSSKE